MHYPSKPQVVDQVPLIEVVSNHPSVHYHPLDSRSVLNGETMLWLLLGVALSGILISLKVIILLRWELRKEAIAPLPSTHKFPCKTCRFFTGSRYLRCAVRPSAALTEQSIHCPDYQLNSEKQR